MRRDASEYSLKCDLGVQNVSNRMKCKEEFSLGWGGQLLAFSLVKIHIFPRLQVSGFFLLRLLELSLYATWVLFEQQRACPRSDSLSQFAIK